MLLINSVHYFKLALVCVAFWDQVQVPSSANGAHSEVKPCTCFHNLAQHCVCPPACLYALSTTSGHAPDDHDGVLGGLWAAIDRLWYCLAASVAPLRWSPDSSTSVTRVMCEHALVFSGKCKKENWSKFSQDLQNHSLFEGRLVVVASPLQPWSLSVVPEKVKTIHSVCPWSLTDFVLYCVDRAFLHYHI